MTRLTDLLKMVVDELGKYRLKVPPACALDRAELNESGTGLPAWQFVNGFYCTRCEKGFIPDDYLHK